MNRKLKAICAAVLAAAICASFAGCKSGKPSGGNTVKQPTNTATSKPANTTVSKPNTTVSTPAVSAPEKAALAMTDEIKNAAFESGLIQINNDIFQMGGYMTVADFVEKYKDRYDIFYANGNLTYEEAAKEQLLQSYTFVGETKYHLTLTPKSGVGDSSKKILVQIENRTTTGGEDKIHLPEAIVTEFCLKSDDNVKTTCPFWYPQGYTDSKTRDSSSGYQDLETANTGYDRDSFLKMLEDKGFTLFEGNPYMGDDLNNRYWKSAAAYEFKVTGEINSFGKRPEFQYQVSFYADTDKLNYVRIIQVNYVD